MTSPIQHDVSQYNFRDLVDVPAFARMLESYFKATGIPNGVVDASGELLSMSSGENACAVFHRVQPQAAERCRESNLAIMRDLREGQVAGGLCKNGLMDYATPVVIEGRQLATLFLGQVLHEPPNQEFFRAQAAQFGFDEKAYLKSIKAIPIISKERAESLMAVMVEMAQMLATSGLAKLRQTTLERDISTHVEKLIQLEDILDFSPVAIGWLDGEGRVEHINREFTQLFGYTLDELPDLETGNRLLYPDERYRETVVIPWIKAAALARQNNTTPPDLEADITCKNGTVRRVVVSVSSVGNHRMVSFTDITERKRMEMQLAARERELRSLVESIPDNIARYTPDARHVYMSPVLERVNGKPKEFLLGRTPMECFPDGRYADYQQRILATASSGCCDEMEMAVPMPDGTTEYHLIRFVAEYDEEGTVVSVLTIGTDITRRWMSEQRMQAHGAMLEMLARGADLSAILNAIVRQLEAEDKTARCSVLLLDAEGKHLLTGAAPNLPKFYTQAIHGIEIGMGVGSCGTAAAIGERVVVEDILTHDYWKPYLKLAQEAELRACWSEPIFSSHHKVLGAFAIYHAVPKRPQAADLERIAFAANLAAIAIESRYAYEELERRAYTDYLTGLANRRHFLEQAENELTRTLRYGGELSILMLDVDHFKLVNDTYGHEVGDLVLKKLSETCLAALRDVDIVGRIGGEEFAVLLPETGSTQAMEAAERMRSALAAAQVTPSGGLPLHFTASLGVTTLVNKDTNINVLLNQADHALYQAKNTGRNKVCVYRSDSPAK